AEQGRLRASGVSEAAVSRQYQFNEEAGADGRSRGPDGGRGALAAKCTGGTTGTDRAGAEVLPARDSCVDLSSGRARDARPPSFCANPELGRRHAGATAAAPQTCSRRPASRDRISASILLARAQVD